MNKGRLIPTREVARLLELPESTVRWYGRQFHDFLPILRDARDVWWKPEALPIIRTIRESFAAGPHDRNRVMPRSAQSVLHRKEA